jgi:predicted transcriptional regulator
MPFTRLCASAEPAGTFHPLVAPIRAFAVCFLRLTPHIQSLYDNGMNTVTFNLSFQNTLISEVDALAKRESRSRSELLREAARLYIQRQKRWESLFALGDSVVRESGLSQGDVAREIQTLRKAKAKKTVR